MLDKIDDTIDEIDDIDIHNNDRHGRPRVCVGTEFSGVDGTFLNKHVHLA